MTERVRFKMGLVLVALMSRRMGESIIMMELTHRLRLEIHRSTKEIKSLGIIHEDLQMIQVVGNRQP